MILRSLARGMCSPFTRTAPVMTHSPPTFPHSTEKGEECQIQCVMWVASCKLKLSFPKARLSPTIQEGGLSRA